MAKFDLTGKHVWVAGHRGMVGSAIVRRLARQNVCLQTVDRSALDLRSQPDVAAWVEAHRPQVVILAAAKVGGILANASHPADFLEENLAIELAVIGAAAHYGVEKLVFLGSTCIYPKFADQPIREEALLTGSLEPTNEWYAIAKIAGLKLAQAYRRQHGFDFISVMPTNLYGPNDNFDLESSHVLPALLRKADDAKRSGAAAITVWGTGTPRREFLHVDDLADACLFLMERYEGSDHINIGTGEDLEIRELAELVRDIVCPTVQIVFDPSKPDGTPRKLLNVGRLHELGWRHHIELRQGIMETYNWFLKHSPAVLEAH